MEISLVQVYKGHYYAIYVRDMTNFQFIDQ